MQRCSAQYRVDGHVQWARKGRTGEEMEEDIHQSEGTEVQADREQSHVGEGREPLPQEGREPSPQEGRGPSPQEDRGPSPQEDRGPPNQTVENPAIVYKSNS